MSSRKEDPHNKHSNKQPQTESRVEYDDLPVPLTQKEKNVLEFLEMFVRESGISPSYQEICNHFGFASFNSVQRYLKQLESKGYIRLPRANQKRAITIVRSASALQETVENVRIDGMRAAESVRNVIPALATSETFHLPLLGRVAAGSPIEAYEHDEFIDVPASLVRHADRTYALRVQGQSMIEDGILDGDVILVQRQASAGNGEIVVAMIGEEATVKRLYTHMRDPRDLQESERSGSRKMIELRPANSNMTSLWFRPDEVQIRGVVVGLIRKF
ncbi:MAG: transcriptional repressor LexA [Bdellovibrionaceae bacterium]|nr:transcriptional repressor LexA [Pseudobdellovibrionaceae bacterium]